MKKTSLLLALLLLAQTAAFASCGDETDAPAVTDKASETASNTADSDNVGTTQVDISDDLPEIDFGGRNFNVLTFDFIKDDFVAEEMNGDVVNDAIYNRDHTVSERFGVNITYNAENSFGDATKLIRSTVLSGDNEFQLVANHVIDVGTLATEGLFLNWYDIPYIDFSKPWWANSTTEELTVNGDRAVLAIGDYVLSTLKGTYCYYYDKKLAEDYGLENLYEVVDSGRWTLEYLKNTVKDIYSDLNGNAEQDSNDFYGLTQSLGSPLEAYFWALGGKIFDIKNGTPELVYENEHTADIVSAVYALVNEASGVCTKREQYSDYHEFASMAFADELTLFAPGTLLMATKHFRTKTNEYGIIPYPKFDENQESYKTMVDGYHAVLAIPKTIDDPEFVGIITEALNAESRRQVFPAYYETALKKKYTYDDESVKLLDMIVDSRVFDFGFVYDGWKGFGFYLQNIINGTKSDNFASYYAKNSQAAIEHYNDVIEALTGEK
ncbi:MAG: hypothetical protein ACI4T6_01265 [Candidatus Flemingiibacterium sp.]